MNISCEIFYSDRSNSFSYSACNSTGENNGFKMVLVVDIITILLGFPTNSYVIWLILTGTGNGLAAEFFSLNFSVCEIFVCMEPLCDLLSYMYKFVWRLDNFLDGLAITGRPLFQCLICVERYLAVVHPVTFLKFKSLRYRLMCSAVVWVTGFGSCTFNFMTWFFKLRWTYFISWVAQFFIFLSIYVFFCVAVLRALKQSGPGERGREREEENHMKRRAFYLILITAVSTVIIYAPYITLAILQESFEYFSNIFDPISNVFFLFAGLVQPLLFLYRVGKLPFIKCQ